MAEQQSNKLVQVERKFDALNNNFCTYTDLKRLRMANEELEKKVKDYEEWKELASHNIVQLMER
jgi:hypothetical protein